MLAFVLMNGEQDGTCTRADPDIQAVPTTAVFQIQAQKYVVHTMTCTYVCLSVCICVCLCMHICAFTLSMFTQAYHPEDAYGARLKYRLATAGEKGFYKCRDDDGRCTASTAEKAFEDPPSAEVGLGDTLCVCVPHPQTRTRTHTYAGGG